MKHLNISRYIYENTSYNIAITLLEIILMSIYIIYL